MFRTPPIYRRLELYLADNVPSQTEVKAYLGASLAQVFFDHGHVETRKLLGVLPPLQGPQEELWISPSDQLIGKVSLKPPLTNKCIKACTHQGILAIGQTALEKYQAEMREKMEKEIQERLEEARKMCEAEKRRAVELAEQELRLKYENYIDTLQKEFEEKLEAALAEAFENCMKMMQKAVSKERVEVTAMMLKRMRDEISLIIGSLYENFEHLLRAQKEKMVTDFNEIIRRERAKVDVKIKELDRQKEEALRVQRNELEMQNIADVTYVLCLERMRCSSEKHAIHQCFEKQIQALGELLMEANSIVNLMKEEAEEKGKDQLAWENKLREVVRQFQKFINFAFGAVPGQAEFLLSLESLLVLEVDDKLRKEEKKLGKMKEELMQPGPSAQFEVVEIIDSCGYKWIPQQLIPDLPQLYCTRDQLMTPIVRSEINFCLCDNYADDVSVASARSLKSYDSLPFCYLENTMYVRSDHRENEPVDARTAAKLAEGSRFIMELRRHKPCNPTIIENITDEVPIIIPSQCSKTVPDTSLQEDNAYDPELVICMKREGCTKDEDPYSPRIQNLIQATQRLSNVSVNDESVTTENESKLLPDEGGSDVNDIMKHLKMIKDTTVRSRSGKETFKIIGENGVEHLQTARQFTCSRMKSLMRIFKLHPSLQKMLIPKSGQLLY